MFQVRRERPHRCELPKERTKANAKAKPKGKGSKGKGKGKKGKLDAVGEGEEDETGEEYWYEEENEAEGESFPVSGVLIPLMLSAVETDDTWHDEGGALQQAEYRAANGSAVKMSSQNVTVYVAFEVFDCWARGARHSSQLALVWEGPRAIY